MPQAWPISGSDTCILKLSEKYQEAGKKIQTWEDVNHQDIKEQREYS